MSVEKVNGFNKLPRKDLRKTSPKKADAEGQPKKSSGPAETSNSTKGPARAKAQPSSKDWVDISIKNKGAASELGSAPLSELVDVATQEKLNAGETQASEITNVSAGKDSVEISMRDPELIERIRALVDKIKADREDLSQRIEAARMLIMRKAYDDDQEVKKTAEAILRGEDVEGFDLNDL